MATEQHAQHLCTRAAVQMGAELLQEAAVLIGLFAVCHGRLQPHRQCLCAAQDRRNDDRPPGPRGAPQRQQLQSSQADTITCTCSDARVTIWLDIDYGGTDNSEAVAGQCQPPPA